MRTQLLALGLFVLLVYNVAIAFVVRQTMHWIYVGFIGSLLNTQALEVNFFSLFNTQHFAPFSFASSLAVGQVFVAFLLGQMSSKWFRWSFTGYCLAFITAVVVFDFSRAYQIVPNVLAPLGVVILSAHVLTGVAQQRRRSKLIIAGWALFISGITITFLASQGAIPPQYLSAYAVGSLLEATVFSIILAYRLRDQDQTAALLVQQRQTNERQKELFAVIGHELRTPVASMAMVADDNDTSDFSARQ